MTQIILGILGNDLSSGQRLPSTRELARRFRLHPNTISAGYRQLERERWVEFRRGSGVYVRKERPAARLSPDIVLDQLIIKLFRSARTLGFTLPVIHACLSRWLTLQPPDHFLLLEPDEGLRKIVAFEMQQAVDLPVKSCCPPDLNQFLQGAIPVTMLGKENIVRQNLPPEAELLTLRFRSVPTSLAKWVPSPADALVGVASHWPTFLTLARTMLIAAGFSMESILFRDTRKANWQRGLTQASAVVCDSVTATKLPRNTRTILFPILAESSLKELQNYEEFLPKPLNP